MRVCGGWDASPRPSLSGGSVRAGRRRHARPSGPSGGRSSLRPNAARGFFLCLGRNTAQAQAQAQCCGLEVAYRLLSKAQACAGVKYMPTASPSSSPPSSSPFPERRSLRPPRPLPRCAEPFLERRKTRKQKMVWRFSHGLDSFGRIEMQIRVLLYRRNGVPVPVVHLTWNCSELHMKLLQNGWNGSLDHLRSGNHLMSLLCRLHTICLTSDSFQSYVILLENASPAYPGYDTNSHKIYITFSAQSREICTAANVHWYFSHFGHVLSVNMRHERSYGFVRFRYPQTVRLLLSSWNPEVPHFILGGGVRVKRYNWNPAENHGPNGPNGGLEHMPNAPGELPGQVPDVPDEDAEQQDMNPAENHGPNGPNGGLEHMPNAPGELPGQVPDVPDEDAEQQDMNPAGNHVPNGLVGVPDQVLGVLDGEAAELDMNPAGNHAPNAPVGVPDQVPNALGGVLVVLDEVPDVPDGDAAQQDMDEITVALPDVDCFYY